MALSFEKNLSPSELTLLRSKVKELSVLEPWRAFLAIALDWLVILAAILVAERYSGLGVFLAALLVITSRQHALGIMVHDAAHYRLMRSQRGNTVLANVLCAYPLFFQMEMYRHNHLLHHQYTNQPKDPDQVIQAGQPDWTFPMSLGKLLRIYGLDFLGRGAVANWKRVARYNSDPTFREALGPELRRNRAIRIAFYIGLFGGLTVFGGWRVFLLYWILPLLWLLPAVLRLRNMAEHYGLSWTNDLQGTRDVICGKIEAWCLAPHAVNLHLVHHFYPSVPFHKLPELRRYLLQFKSFGEGAHTNSSYILPKNDAVWRDWISIGPS